MQIWLLLKLFSLCRTFTDNPSYPLGKYGFSGTSKENAVNDKKKQDYKNGGVYTVVFKDGLHNNISNLEYMRYQNTEPNLYPIFWQVREMTVVYGLIEPY